MGAAKEMWMDEVERVGDDFLDGKHTREEAISALVRLGFDLHEAETMIDEAIA